MAEPNEPSLTSRHVLPYVMLVFLGVVPTLAIGAYSYYLAAESIENDIVSANRVTAQVTANLVESEFAHWLETVGAFARRPQVIAAARAGDEAAMRTRLDILVDAHPRMGRAFVTDETALLWSDYPKAPESLGKRFDDRDWYRGVKQAWKPYVSEVYRRNAEPKLLVVAVAAPIHDPESGALLAIAVAQVELDSLAAVLNQVKVGEGGHVVLLDHKGIVAAHPSLDLQARTYPEYTPQAEALRAAGHGEYDDPFSAEGMMAASADAKVGDTRWTAVVQQPAEGARAPIRALALQIMTAGVLLVLMAGVFAVLLARDRRKVLMVGRELNQLNRQLIEEIATRQKAEKAVKSLNDDLEQRVEQRTAELRSTEDQLLHAQKMEAVGRLAGGVAHDFNNMLSVIIGYANLMKDELPADSPQRADLEQIRAAGERAADLTRQLLAFSRKQVLQPVVLDLNEVVSQVSKMLKRLIGEDIRLVSILDPKLSRIKADPGQLEQIIMNLAINARDAMSQGGKLTIETGQTELDADYAAEHPDVVPGNYVFLAVSDTGIGMDAATRARIFEPFFTTKGVGAGTGLGLPMVYGIVKQSGGSIWVYSEVGQGTTFKIYLPAIDAPATTKPVAPVAQQSGAGATVLLVEDEPGVRKVARRVLEEAGYKVLEADGAEPAFALFDQHADSIDMLLTDVVLPGKGGPAIAAELQSRRPGLKVLFMSGYTDNAIVHHGVLDPGIAFLEKPFRPAALLAKVREVLDAGA